jgi:hypothetical protein
MRPATLKEMNDRDFEVGMCEGMLVRYDGSRSAMSTLPSLISIALHFLLFAP